MAKCLPLHTLKKKMVVIFIYLNRAVNKPSNFTCEIMCSLTSEVPADSKYL